MSETPQFSTDDVTELDAGTRKVPKDQMPGVANMPAWNVGELIDAPKFGWRQWTLLLGPGLLMGGSAIGGGEWLMGPLVTAKYGGSLLWLATLSILGQVIYNLEISRYTLYTGEPIFTGKFRMVPGPTFWVFIYLLLDFGSVFPYLAANAATPLAAVILGHIPDPENVVYERHLLKYLGYGIFLAAMIPLVFGGKIYNSLKALMTFKIVTVMGFLIVLGMFYSHTATWVDIFGGFVKFGNLPIRRGEDLNHNGKLDPGEDWDHDGRLDVKEPMLKPLLDSDGDGKPDATDIYETGQPDNMVTIQQGDETVYWPDLDKDGQPDKTVLLDTNNDDVPDTEFPLDADQDGKLDTFVDIDGPNKDGHVTRDGDNVANIFTTLYRGEPMPDIDWSMIAFLSALVAISGSGGLSNTPVSNYTRDQGWGMGHLVGAIPSVVGGQDLELSHEGTVFVVNDESLPRWKRWYKHILRDQLVVWMPACFFGLALPSMLSVQFLPRGAVIDDQWTAAGMTAGAVQDAVGGTLGQLAWFMTLFCGFLVLAPSMATSADGVIRRWVDVFWTSSPRLHKVEPKHIRYVYFAVLTVYATFGMIMLTLGKPVTLLLIATTIFNFALGFSCWHTLWLNLVLLPQQIRPGWFARISLFLSGCFFWTVATISATITLQKFGLL